MSLLEYMQFTGSKCWSRLHALPQAKSYSKLTVPIDRKNKTGYILDPTVRFETSLEQPKDVNKKKYLIYELTTVYFKTCYNLEISVVMGHFIGSQGTIIKQFLNFCTKFKLPKINSVQTCPF